MGANDILAVDVHQDCSPTNAEKDGSRSSPFGNTRRRLPIRPTKSATVITTTHSKQKQKTKRRRRIKEYNEKPLALNIILGFTLLFLFCYAYVSYHTYALLRNHHKDPSSSQIMQNQTLSEQGKSSSSASFAAEDWEFEGVVHVIQTRLMQFQPNLINLGLARLEFFRVFCLPTMLEQTSQNFLWIIRTDPALNTLLKTKLLDMIGYHPNILLVASNANHEGWRGHGAIEFNASHVWAGSYDLAVHFHEAAQTSIVLETRLDADDGLHSYFVENIQSQALEYLDTSIDSVDNVIVEPKWMVWCAKSHLEWQHSSPWHHTNNTKYGYLVGVKKKDCITPGLTMGYGLGAIRSDLPAGHHSKIHSSLPSCEDTNRNNTHCLERFGVDFPGAVRARSPTSAGMKRVIIGKYGNRREYKAAINQQSIQEMGWEGLERGYGITRSEATVARSYLTQHLVEICEENLRGQCTKGHSCKPSSVKYLKQLINNPPLEG